MVRRKSPRKRERNVKTDDEGWYFFLLSLPLMFIFAFDADDRPTQNYCVCVFLKTTQSVDKTPLETFS